MSAAQREAHACAIVGAIGGVAPSALPDTLTSLVMLQDWQDAGRPQQPPARPKLALRYGAKG